MKGTRAKPASAASSADSNLELDKFLPYVLVNLAKRLSSTLATTYQREYDLSIPEWRVVANLNQSGSLTSKEIGQQTYMDKVTVSRAIKNLSDKGWVKKQAHPEDSRAHIVSLTRKGRAVIEKLAPRVLQWESALLECLSGQEYRLLIQAIGKLDGRLDFMGDF